MITVNHFYTLGPKALLLGAVLALGPTALLWWFRSTKNRIAFAGYQLVSLWIVLGFGLLKGLWGSVLPVYEGTLLALTSTMFPTPTLGSYGYEASGILMFVGSLFVGYYGVRMIEAARHASVPPESEAPKSPRHRALVAVGTAIALGLVTVAYGFAVADRWTPPAGGVVKVGVIVPSSGPYSVLGNSFLKAVEVAKDDQQGTKYEYRLVLVDVGSDPKAAPDTIRRAVKSGEVDVILGGISLFGQITKPLATAERIPHLCVCSVMAIGDGAYNFTNIPSPEAEGARWVEEARSRSITRIAILSQSYPSIAGHVRAVKSEALQKGLQIASEQTFDANIADFQLLIERAKESKPDVYYIEGLEPALDRLARQLANAGIRNLASVVAPSISQSPALFEGAWYTDSNLRDFGFKRRFEDRFPGMQFATHMMPYAYDNFNLVVQAYEHGQNPAVYVRNIRSYQGTAGLLSKAPGSGNFQSMPAVWVIKDGKPKLVR
jgi:ABC-type branched-subunit amino acid transport system substrate-binding protein